MLAFCLAGSIYAGNPTIGPRFYEGDSVVYETHTHSVSAIGGDPMAVDIDVYSTVSYAVAERLEEGCILRVIVSDYKIENHTEMTNMAQDLLNNPLALLKGVPIELEVDIFGRVKHVRNLANLQQGTGKLAEELVDKAFKENPGLFDFMPREAFKVQLESTLVEEVLINNLISQINSPLLIWGKEIKVGNKFNFTLAQHVNSEAQVTRFQPTTPKKNAAVEVFAVKEVSADNAQKQILDTPEVRAMLQKLPEDQVNVVLEHLQSYSTRQSSTATASYNFFQNGFMSDNKAHVVMDLGKSHTTMDTNTSCTYYSWGIEKLKKEDKEEKEAKE